MVTITSHIFINIFQKVHFQLQNSPGMRKYELSYQNLWKFEKNLKQSDWVPLKSVSGFIHTCYFKNKFDITKNRTKDSYQFEESDGGRYCQNSNFGIIVKF